MVGIGRAAGPQMAAGKGRALSSPLLPDLTPPEAERRAHTICQTLPSSKNFSKYYWTLTLFVLFK